MDAPLLLVSLLLVGTIAHTMSPGNDGSVNYALKNCGAISVLRHKYSSLLPKHYVHRNAAGSNALVLQCDDERLLRCGIAISNVCMNLTLTTYAVWLFDCAEPSNCSERPKTNRLAPFIAGSPTSDDPILPVEILQSGRARTARPQDRRDGRSVSE